MRTYSQIVAIEDPKERLFAILEKIDHIKFVPIVIRSQYEQIELENLEELKMSAYSDWKDPK